MRATTFLNTLCAVSTVLFESRVLGSAADLTATNSTPRLLEYSIDEELEPGSFVADLRHDLRQCDDDGVDYNSRFFFINHNNGNRVVHLDLDELTGILTTSKSHRIDRESLHGFVTGSGRWTPFHGVNVGSTRPDGCCSGSTSNCDRCLLIFDIIVQPEMSIVTVVLEICDINDNSPKFSFGDGASIGFYESSEPGTELVIGSVTDADGSSAGNGLDRCELSSMTSGTTGKFDLVVRRRADDQFTVDLYIVLQDKLDREFDGNYQVQQQI